MYSLRRAALRSALSASRAVASKPSVAVFASRFGRNAEVTKSCVIPAARYFSQTRRVAAAGEEEEAGKEDAAREVESAADGAEAEAEAAKEAVEAHDPDETPYALFIRNIVFDANEQHLKDAFEKYGTVAKTVIARDARGLSRGYGFVWFSTAEEMNKAAAEANGSFWHGRRIVVQPRAAKRVNQKTTSAARNEPTRCLYIGNIPYETTDAELNRLFNDLENVTDVRVAVDRTTGWPRGFAHADFGDVESAVKAYTKLVGQTLGGRELRFDYAGTKERGTVRGTSKSTPPESAIRDF